MDGTANFVTTHTTNQRRHPSILTIAAATALVLTLPWACASNPAAGDAPPSASPTPNDHAAPRTEQLVERIAQLQHRLYLAGDQQQRSIMLPAMLSDELPPVRQLAMDMLGQRLLDQGAEEIGPDLRAALLQRLDDTNVDLQRRAVLLLRDLADNDAADAVALKLAASDRNTPAPLVRAYLLMVSRLPRAEAVRPALDLLDDPAFQAEAAAALASAADAKLLSDDDEKTAARRARALVDKDDAARPALIALLGRVGVERDWRRLARWLDSEDPVLREAVARAWAASDRTLLSLAQRADDPNITPIALAAITQRGRQGETLLALIEHPPADADLTDAWRNALVALAGRVDPDDVLTAAQDLASRAQSETLRLDILSAAINAILPPVATNDQAQSTTSQQPTVTAPQPLLKLLAARARLHAAIGDAQAAFVDLQRMEAVQPALADSRSSHAAVAKLILELLRAQIDAGNQDAVAPILIRLRELIEPSANAQLLQQIAELELAIQPAEQSPDPSDAANQD